MDIKGRYPKASIVDGKTVVFDIRGNEYRLTVEIDYCARIVLIKHMETHRDYNRRLGLK